jgi:hypothetical protein
VTVVFVHADRMLHSYSVISEWRVALFFVMSGFVLWRLTVTVADDDAARDDTTTCTATRTHRKTTGPKTPIPDKRIVPTR